MSQPTSSRLLCLRRLLALAFSLPLMIAAEDIYISQSGLGANTGTGAGDARSLAWLNTDSNWGTGTGKVGAGDTVHLVGTLTSPLRIRGDGAAGNPITIRFESGARFVAGVWPASGAIEAPANHIVIDGGANGLILATDCGTLMQHPVDTRGVYSTGASDLTIRNLTVTNLYVRVPFSSDSGATGDGIYVRGTGTDILIENCRVYEAGNGITLQYDPPGGAKNWKVTGNVARKCSNGIIIGSANVGAKIDGVEISRNRISGNYAWDGVWNNGTEWFHQDGIQGWAEHTDTLMQNVKVHSNTVGPDIGGNWHTTGWIFFSGKLKNIQVYNNLLYSTSGNFPSDGYIFLWDAQSSLIANNTIYAGGGGQGIRILGGTVTVRNNIIDGANTGLYVDTPGTLSSCNNNLFYNLNPTEELRYGTFQSFAEWKALGFDKNSAFANPLFVSTLDSSIDLHLQATSPARGTGANLSSSFTTDAAGTARGSGAWDIGALAYGGSTPPPPTQPPDPTPSQTLPQTEQQVDVSLAAVAAPFELLDGAIYQPLQTGDLSGGRASFTIEVSQTGDYGIVGVVNAPTDGNNSFFVNVDGEPPIPASAWHIPVTSGFEAEVGSWQGSGTAGSPQYIPKYFALSPGTHTVVVRGRESNTSLRSLGLYRRPAAPNGVTAKIP